MVAIIILNLLFAVAVVGGVVGLLAHSIFTSRIDASVQPGRSRARAQAARRRLAPAAG